MTSNHNEQKVKPETLLLSPKRHVERSILILDTQDELLLEKSWNKFQSGIGLFSGLGVKWREDLIGQVENLFIEKKEIAEIFYQGLRDEYVYIQNRINYFKVQYHYTQTINMEYVNPGIHTLFVEYSESHMQTIMHTAQRIQQKTQNYLSDDSDE